MWVAVVVLFLHGQPVMHGQTEKTFVSNGMENGCSSWLAANVPTLASEIEARGLPFTIQARCDRTL